MSLDLKTLPFANDLPKGLSAGFSQADCVVEPSLVDLSSVESSRVEPSLV